jgi:hypothetical protein
MLTDTVRLQPNCHYLFVAKPPKTITIVSFLRIYISLSPSSFSLSSFLFSYLSLSLSYLCYYYCYSLLLLLLPRYYIAISSAASPSNACLGY